MLKQRGPDRSVPIKHYGFGRSDTVGIDGCTNLVFGAHRGIFLVGSNTVR